MAAPRRGSAPTYKVVLLGELGVGKTSLLRRLKDNTFDEYDDKCRGIDSCTKVVKVDGETVVLSIWDASKYDRWLDLSRDTPYPNYHKWRNAHAAVFVYSISEASSLHYLTQWIKDTQMRSPNAVQMLIGNMEDLEPEIDPTTARSFAEAHEFELQFEISCKTNSGIEEAFEQLARVLHKPCQRPPETDSIITGTQVDADVNCVHHNVAMVALFFSCMQNVAILLLKGGGEGNFIEWLGRYVGM